MKIRAIKDCKFATQGGIVVKDFCEGEDYNVSDADGNRMIAIGLAVEPVPDEIIEAMEVEVPSPDYAAEELSLIHI